MKQLLTITIFLLLLVSSAFAIDYETIDSNTKVLITDIKDLDDNSIIINYQIVSIVNTTKIDVLDEKIILSNTHMNDLNFIQQQVLNNGIREHQAEKPKLKNVLKETVIENSKQNLVDQTLKSDVENISKEKTFFDNVFNWINNIFKTK